MRARLLVVAQDESGDIQPNTAVVLTKFSGAAFTQTLYTAASGGSVVTSPRTDSLGLLVLYADLPERVKLTIAGVSGTRDGEFLPDWTATDTPTSGRANTLSGPGDAAAVLTVQATVGGTGGNKVVRALHADGTVSFETKVHGLTGVGSATTDTALFVNRVLIGNANAQPRIFADLSDASAANRLLIQSTVAGGTADLGIVPNGVGLSAALTLWGRSSTNSSEGGRLSSSITNGTVLESFAVALTAQDITIRPNQVESLRFKVGGDICQLDGGHVTTDTAGFFYLASSAGPPTGIPTARSGLVPMAFDRNNLRLYAYMGGSWVKVQFA